MQTYQYFSHASGIANGTQEQVSCLYCVTPRHYLNPKLDGIHLNFRATPNFSAPRVLCLKGHKYEATTMEEKEDPAI